MRGDCSLPLEGEGRLTLSAAKCEPGWGDLSTRHRSRGETVTPPRRSTGRRCASPGRVDPKSELRSSRPLQGRVSRTLHFTFSKYGTIRPEHGTYRAVTLSPIASSWSPWAIMRKPSDVST